MQSKTVGELVHLTERGAVAHHFDSRNYRFLRLLLLVAVPFALVAGLTGIGKAPIWSHLAWIPALLVALWIFLTRRSRFFERHARRLTLLYLALLPVATVLSIRQPEAAYGLVGYLVPALLLFFRLDPREYLALAGVDAAAVAWTLLRPGIPEETGAKIGLSVGSALVIGIILAIAMRVTRQRRQAFLDQWHHEVARERDSSRMRTELEDARGIQLSMLPVGAPELDWVDFSSTSLPASEVGGDYFDYFELADSRLAIVIADVAGHGMASGMVLAGVRSSLHLLAEDLIRPVEVLRKLDRMLRKTAANRLYVTLQLAVLDPEIGRVTVANAGHPPLFLLSPDGGALRLGGNSLPLGTRLGGDFEEESEALHEGDILLFFSDGVSEARSYDGVGFGEDRLLKELRRSPADASACHIRDSLLQALAGFQEDVEQADDQTLVVVKIGDTSGITRG